MYWHSILKTLFIGVASTLFITKLPKLEVVKYVIIVPWVFAIFNIPKETAIKGIYKNSYILGYLMLTDPIIPLEEK